MNPILAVLTLALLVAPWCAVSAFSVAPRIDSAPVRYSRPAIVSSNLFGGLFGSSDTKNDSDEELASFADFPASQKDGLTEYIREWAKLLETEGSLTTPIQVMSTPDQGVQILFRPKESTYQSKDEERAAEEGTAEKKSEPQKQGGVQVMVEEQDGGKVKVAAKRCEMDEDTMIREMSEEAILSGLKKAINVWRKDHLE